MTTEQQPVLQLSGVSKLFGNVRAVDNISLDVREGEVLTLLGPSGCGKTTTLRMVIGLERCTSGEISYEGKLVDSSTQGLHVPTHKRNMGMVFQSYAIWPHMTVFENIAYPLRVRHEKGPVVREEVNRAIDLVGLSGLGDRPATMLSGGQQQRVALARALVFHPRLLLLDEPFSNLDARLREQMRTEVKQLQRRLGITVLFVTHDQLEALSLSDRIAIMHQGSVQQVGPPDELYRRPASPIVRDFLGRTILLHARAAGGSPPLVTLDDGSKLVCGLGDTDLAAGEECTLAIRPEYVEVTDGAGNAPSNSLTGVLETLLFAGDHYEANLRIGPETIQVHPSASGNWSEGQKVRLVLPAEHLQVWAGVERG